jgi:hypothetical protein
MPKMQHWLIASKMVEVLSPELTRSILDQGGIIGGGWCEIHQHICVNTKNKETIEAQLAEEGFTVSYPSEHRVRHPECIREAGLGNSL